ncbi:MAG TPA: hypothetical protein VGM69_03960 [Chloroflexota bacterium]|jgi:hypothetical protein
MVDVQTIVQGELRRRLDLVGALLDVRLESLVRGKHRNKNWDVAVHFAKRPCLAISTKAIISNPSGTVPNRIDDAMGECVNVHAFDPGMVLGYLFVFDARWLPSGGSRNWSDTLAGSLASFSGRRSEHDAPELFEAATLLIVDFVPALPELRFHPDLLNWDEFFDVLVGHVRVRQPLIDRYLGLLTGGADPSP